jgi:Na+/H+-dicarboxylate symporter
MRRGFTFIVILAMVLGVAVGWAVNTYAPDAATAKSVADNLQILTDIFLRLIKMIIAPLVFSTLVVGVAHMEDAAAIGRVGSRTIGWFLLASLASLLLGVGLVSLIRPGDGLNMALPHAAAGAAKVETSGLSLRDFITHVVPTSIAQAMANNEILQIVVFSLFVGTAVAQMEDRAPAVMRLAEQVAQVMMKVTGYVMWFAPLAVFAALASTVATQGLGVLTNFATFVGGFYLALALLWALLLVACTLVIGPRAFGLAGRMREPVLIAFSTASSEAAYPRTLEELQKFGVAPRIASFVLPLGYSFNLDGSTMYCTFATLFIAQAYGIVMTPAQIAVMLLFFMLTSKGMAGVPRASLVVIAAGLSFFRLPEAGLVLILTVDHLLDMGRSATNVVGNSVASAVVAKWERQLTKPAPAKAAPVKA